MTKLRRQSLTAYEAPLCETIVDCPEPKGSEVLVRIERCGVCHSDLHMQDGYFALGDGNKLDVRAGWPDRSNCIALLNLTTSSASLARRLIGRFGVRA